MNKFILFIVLVGTTSLVHGMGNGNNAADTVTSPSTDSGVKKFSIDIKKEVNEVNPADKAASDSDKQININVRNLIKKSFPSNYNYTIFLNTANGVVVLTGSVDKREDVQKLIDDTKKVSGVKDVISNMSVTQH